MKELNEDLNQQLDNLNNDRISKKIFEGNKGFTVKEKLLIT